MEKNFKLTNEILWDYADGFLNEEDKLRVDAYLRQNPAKQTQLDGILSEKCSFSTLPLEKPNAGFTQQVMSAWTAEQTDKKAPVNVKAIERDWVLWGIAAAFGLIIVLPFLLSPSAAPSTITLHIQEQYMPQVQVPTFDWAGFMNGASLRNFLLLTLTFMGLKLLDKYLQVRNLHLSGH
jgi:anti-sigma factor RsiW